MERGEEVFAIIENCLMVRLPRELDQHRTSCLCEEADRYIVEEGVEHVVFDFEKTTFMDSSGIGLILGRYKKISCFGGRVFVIHSDAQIQRMLQLSGVTGLVEILN